MILGSQPHLVVLSSLRLCFHSFFSTKQKKKKEQKTKTTILRWIGHEEKQLVEEALQQLI